MKYRQYPASVTNRGTIRIIAIAIALLTCLTSLTILAIQPASALIRQQQESPEQTLYQSRHRLQDTEGQTWQVILFKRIKVGQQPDIQLRLVGFPDRVVFEHPTSLTLKLANSQILKAEDQLAQNPPASNVGQYNLQTVLDKIPTSTPLELSIPLNTGTQHLLIPSEILLEWQYLARQA